MKDTMFLYAVSRVKALENNLLSRSTVDRMLEAGTPDEALKILRDRLRNYFGDGQRIRL